ncbi:MAG: threonine/serine exporter family protein [Erysipelotrichia bacterium]|nr:threonine/serine exporter family protein [Erysipelotrichia bacterium]
MEKNEIKQESKLVQLLLLMGENYIQCGAEIWRVEDMINRIGYAYGAQEVNAFVITSSIVLTICYADGHIETQTKRIKRLSNTDLNKLEQLNGLSRKICQKKIPLEQFEKELLSILTVKENRKELLLGNILASGAFAMFFGGNIIDVLLAALVGIAIYYLQIYVEPICMNSIVFKFIASLLTGAIISVLSALVVNSHRDVIMIGNIMLLIPGVMFTNSLRDALLGDTLSGTLRFIEAALLASAVVAGFITALFLVGRFINV